MRTMPISAHAGQLVAFPVRPGKASTQSADTLGIVAPAPITTDTVRFGNQQQPGILDDPMLLNFNVPVTPETCAQLSTGLMKIAEQKKKLGGSVKLLINTPGGDVYAGLQPVQFIKRLGVPVDSIIMGGQAASMGSMLFLAATGRRILTPDASLMIHQPSVSGVSGTLADLKQVVGEMDGLFRRMQRLIQEKTGLPAKAVTELTANNNDFRVFPLKALQMGFATHVLLEDNTALSKDSIKHLSSSEIERRDREGDYANLRGEAFDPQIMNPEVYKKLMARHPGGMDGAPGGFQSSGGPIHFAAPKETPECQKDDQHQSATRQPGKHRIFFQG